MNKRKFKEGLYKFLLWASAIITVAILIFIIGFIVLKGYKGISINFLIKDYSPTGGGGVLPMILTTLYTVLLSIGIATPIGILAAVYLVEYAKQGKVVKIIRFATESLSGIPSIVYGLFGAILFVDVFLKTSRTYL